MKYSEILEEIGDEDDLIEQFRYDGANMISSIFNTVKIMSDNFTLVPDKIASNQMKNIGIKMFAYRKPAIDALGENSNTVQRINIVLNYIQKL